MLVQQWDHLISYLNLIIIIFSQLIDTKYSFQLNRYVSQRWCVTTIVSSQLYLYTIRTTNSKEKKLFCILFDILVSSHIISWWSFWLCVKLSSHLHLFKTDIASCLANWWPLNFIDIISPTTFMNAGARIFIFFVFSNCFLFFLCRFLWNDRIIIKCAGINEMNKKNRFLRCFSVCEYWACVMARQKQNKKKLKHAKSMRKESTEKKIVKYFHEMGCVSDIQNDEIQKER